MNSEMDIDGFQRRVRMLIGSEQPFAWAKRVGVPSATFDRMWNGKSVPRAEHLLQIAHSCGVSIDWLLTGVEPMMVADRQLAEPLAPPAPASASTPAAPAVDEELMALIIEGISTAYKERNIPLPPRHLGSAAARLLADLTAAGCETPEERQAGIKALLARLRRDLSAPTTAVGSGKEAS